MVEVIQILKNKQTTIDCDLYHQKYYGIGVTSIKQKQLYHFHGDLYRQSSGKDIIVITYSDNTLWNNSVQKCE